MADYCEVKGSNPTMDRCVFIVKAIAICGLVQGMHTPTAMLRSTQPPILCGTAK